MNLKVGEGNDLSKKNIIVTGATGFIGRHLVNALLKENYNVIVLVRDLKKLNKIKNLNNIKIIEYDIDNPHQKINLPPQSTLIHCAWGNVRNINDMVHIEKHFINNFLFLKNIINLGVKNIIVTGTCFEYGLQYGGVSAMDITKPNTPYAIAKDFLHKSLRVLQDEFKFNLIWARIFYTYGDGQDKNSVISLFDSALKEGDLKFNMSFGEQLFDYLPIEKIANYLVALIKHQNGVINICSGEPISLRRLLEKRMKEKGKNIELNLGVYDYRKNDALAIWGSKTFEAQLNNLIKSNSISVNK